MDYVLNSGAENILNGLKKYMGDDENVIMSAFNVELLDLRKSHMIISVTKPWTGSWLTITSRRF